LIPGRNKGISSLFKIHTRSGGYLVLTDPQECKTPHMVNMKIMVIRTRPETKNDYAGAMLVLAGMT
jgi:hypothetical protein